MAEDSVGIPSAAVYSGSELLVRPVARSLLIESPPSVGGQLLKNDLVDIH